MALTPAQFDTLKADVLADPVLSALEPSSDAINKIIEAYAAPSAANIIVWKSTSPVANIYDTLNWKNFTPTDTPDGTQLWLNRAMACQGKQFNMQTMLLGRENLNTGKVNIRQGLKDSLQNVPAGANGALVDAGWSSVKDAITRTATRLEALFATGTGTQGSPGTLEVEGTVSYQEVLTMMGW